MTKTNRDAARPHLIEASFMIPAQRLPAWFLSFSCFYSLEFISDFVLRISDFPR